MESIKEVVACASPTKPNGTVPDGIEPPLQALSDLIDGCRDDPKGCKAKASLCSAFIEASGKNALDVVCAMHLCKSVKIDTHGVLRAISWKKASFQGASLSEAGHPGLYLASTLATSSEGDMLEHVTKYVAANPHVDVVDCLRFINRVGFTDIDQGTLKELTDWKRPAAEVRARSQCTHARLTAAHQLLT